MFSVRVAYVAIVFFTIVYAFGAKHSLVGAVGTGFRAQSTLNVFDRKLIRYSIYVSHVAKVGG